MSNNGKIAAIIGAGHAGVQAAASLREYGWQDRILLIDKENRLPYERPPLSKTFDKERAIVSLRAQTFYDDKKIELLLGTSVEAIDIHQQALTLSDQSTLIYDQAIFCPGSGPLRISPFTDDAMAGVYVLRNAPDEAKMRHDIENGSLKRLLIIGAGFIGIETATALADTLDKIAMIDLAPSAMERGVIPKIADLCVQEARKSGVEIQFDVKVESFQKKDKDIEITLSNGKQLHVDGILMSVGARPNDDLLVQAGICQHRELSVAHNCSVPNAKNLYAVGDVALAQHPLLDLPPARLESVDVAILQAKMAAAAICGVEQPRIQAPWFWSTQGKNKIQMVGIKSLATQWVYRENSTDDRVMASAFGFDAHKKLVAAQCFNTPKDFAASRKFWGQTPDGEIEQLNDPSTAMKDLFH